MSRVIAVAGGTSPTLGRSIVDAITRTENKPVILSRTSSKPASLTTFNVEVRPVDYTDHASLVEALKDVHTVISVLKIPGPEWLQYQVNLLRAAEKAGVKRFAPSEFENGPAFKYQVDILGLKPLTWEHCKASSLECARFNCGMFMNYLGVGKDFGGDERRELEVMQGLVDLPIIWDIAGGVAEVPVKADGTTPKITMTDIRDVGHFVAAACCLPDRQWTSSMEMVGEIISIDEVTKLIEEVAGKKMVRIPVDGAEFQRRADGIEGMGSTREEMATKMISQINIAAIEEQPGMCVLHPVINRLCPEVEPSTVRGFLSKCWA